MNSQIALATLITALMLIVEHYWPWQAMLKGQLNKIFAYILGLLAIDLPFTALMIVWEEWEVITALWWITGVGGAVVITINLLDRLYERDAAADISSNEAQNLRPNHGSDDE